VHIYYDNLLKVTTAAFSKSTEDRHSISPSFDAPYLKISRKYEHKPISPFKKTISKPPFAPILIWSTFT